MTDQRQLEDERAERTVAAMILGLAALALVAVGCSVAWLLL